MARYEQATKTLFLEGTGSMYDYDREGNFAPWVDQGHYRIEHLSVSDGITSIGDCAFYMVGCFEELELPESVSRIGKYAFALCTSLETASLPAVKELDDYAFYTCVGLTKLELSPGLERIGDGCFILCPKLSDITVPETVTEIGNYVFTDCSDWYRAQTDDYVILGDGILCKYLGEETDLVIPDSVKQIAADFLMKPEYLHKKNDVQFIPEKQNDSITSVVIPEGVTEIRLSTFSGCVNLTEVEVPKSVHSIGTDAFKDTPWLKSAADPLILGDGILYRYRNPDKIVPIPEQVHTICTSAFCDDKIVEIQIPKTVTTIEDGAIDCKRAVIAGEAGGIAEAFASEHEIPFRDINAAAPQGDDLIIDYEKDGWYFGNSGEIFGGDYYLTDADRQRLLDFGLDTKGISKDWGGSCVGLALTVILAKNGVFAPNDLQSGAQTLSDVQPTDAVRSFINYYQCTQGRDGTTTGMSDFQMIYNMSVHLPNVKHGESPFLLTFCCASGGSHGVAAYGLENGVWRYGGKEYDRRILVWDSNHPDALYDDSCLYFDSLTLDFCIPAYGVHVAEGAGDNTAGLISARNDLSVLNAYPYPLAKDKPGDVNLDGSVDVSDAVLVARFAAEDRDAVITDQGRKNADVTHDGNVDGQDTTKILRYIAKKITLADLAE